MNEIALYRENPHVEQRAWIIFFSWDGEENKEKNQNENKVWMLYISLDHP